MIAGSSGYTDHYPTFIILEIGMTKKLKKETFEKTFFTKENHLQRREGLRQENWNEVYEQNDPNLVYDLIITKYAKHYNETKTVKICKKGSSRYKREPWMTNELLTDMRKRDRLVKG